MRLNIKNFFTALFFMFTYNSAIYAQDLSNNFKSWSEIILTYNATKNLRAKVSQLVALNVSPLEYSFSQAELSLSYRIKRRTYVEAGFVRGFYSYSNSLKNQGANSEVFNTLAVDRVFGSFSYKHYLINHLSLKHKIEFQYFFPDLRKYKTRSIYSVRLGYSMRKLRLAPYVESLLYYYQGGAALSAGIKNVRLKTGVSFIPFKNSSLGVSVYYLVQDEFGTKQLVDNDYKIIGSSIAFKF